MRVKGAKIDWYEGFGNDPKLQLLVDKIPEQHDLVYIPYEIGHGYLYLAWHENYVHYLYHDPDDERGFGGRCFNLRTQDGVHTVCGPWSSRAGAVNSLLFHGQEVMHIVDVLLTDKERDFERGFTFENGAVSLTLARIAATHADCVLEQITQHTDVYYVPRKPLDWRMPLTTLPYQERLLLYAFKEVLPHASDGLKSNINNYFTKYYGRKWAEKLMPDLGIEVEQWIGT